MVRSPLDGRVKRAHPAVNYENSIARGLLLAVPFTYGLHDLSGRGFHGTHDGTAIKGSRYGPVVDLDATTDRVNFGASDAIVIPTSGGFSARIIQEKQDGTSRNAGAFGVDSATNTHRCGAHLPWADGTAYWDFGGDTSPNSISAASLTYGLDVWILTTGQRGMEMWQNGVKVASSGDNPTRTGTSGDFKLGLHSSAAPADIVEVHTFECWKRQLSEGEIHTLSKDWWGLYEPDVPRVFMPSAPTVAHYAFPMRAVY
jgi:hypothetical protein